MLKINLLGNVKIELNGEEISERLSNKSVAIIALLLFEKGKEISRKRLLLYLWPDSSDDAAKYNLRYNLWQIKKTIPQDSLGRDFLLVTKDRCRINGDYSYSCDVIDIMNAEISDTVDIKSLEKLKERFRGDFLENLNFPGCNDYYEMVIMQQYSLEKKKLFLYRQLVKFYYSSHEWDKCTEALTEMEELDPYDEEMALIYLKILIETKMYSQAARYYHEFYNRMTVDLGIEPSGEIKELARKIKKVSRKASDIISINVSGPSSVDYYLMADIIKELNAEDGLNITDYIDQNDIEALSYIQNQLGKPERPVSGANIAAAFVNLIVGICRQKEYLQITVSTEYPGDRLSNDVVNFASKKCKGKLIIKHTV